VAATRRFGGMRLTARKPLRLAFAVACAVTTFYLGGLIAVLAVFVLLIAAERLQRHLAAR